MPFIDIDGIQVHYFEAGTGDPVLFLHTGPGHGGDWRAVIAKLDSSYHCLAPDLYFRGKSGPWPVSGNYSLDRDAALTAFLVSTTQRKAHLVGHSFGGAAAARCALLYPELIQTLTLIEPQTLPLLKEVDEQELFEILKSISDRFAASTRGGNPEPGWREFVDYYNGEGTWSSMPEHIRARFLEHSETTVILWNALFQNPTSAEDFRSIPFHTLIIAGSDTTMPERRICELLSDLINDSVLQTIEGAGHMSPLTHPDLVADLTRVHIHDWERQSSGLSANG